MTTQALLEMAQLRYWKPAYTVSEWAEACGLGETTIYNHINSGHLDSSFPNSKKKQIITLENGLDWLRRLPTIAPDAGE